MTEMKFYEEKNNIRDYQVSNKWDFETASSMQ